MRKIVAYFAGAVTASAASLLVITGPSAADPPPGGRVVVLLKNQLSDQPATAAGRTRRRASALATQRSVLAAIHDTTPREIRHFSVGNAFSATVDTAQAAALAANPSVAAVIPDVPPPNRPDTGKTTGTPGSACPTDPTKPLREPEALSLIHAPSGLSGGAGVRVGYIADGVDPANPDFIRPDGSRVISDYQDFTGTGTAAKDGGEEAFGDVSSIAAQGRVVHDLHGAGAPTGCTVRIFGAAPGADVIALKAIGIGSTLSSILQAIDYALNTAHVDVLNESFGFYQYPDAGARNAIQVFNDEAVAAGVTVVAASGDAGTAGTISSPGADPGVISVGASTALRLYAQLGAGTHWLDGNIADFSSSGITDEGRTIDLVAPGMAGWATCSPGYAGCVSAAGAPTDTQQFAGTSESAPFTSAAAALVIQAFRQHHRGRSPAPALVRQLLTSTAQDLGAPADDQGAGQLDIAAAVRAATGASGLMVSADQLDLTARPDQPRRGNIRVTNTGPRPITLTPAVLGYAPKTHTTTTISTPAPISITVPPGAAQLIVHVTRPGKFSRGVHLFAPDGALANVSTALFNPVSTLTAVHPAPGTWTVTPDPATTGSLIIDTVTTTVVRAGTATPGRLVLRPGATRRVSATVTGAPQGGDASDQLRLTDETTIPLITRTLVKGSFGGELAAGVGRLGAPAQSLSYAFDVPAGKPALTAVTTLAPAGSAPDKIAGLLIDPHGEAQSIARNGDGDTVRPVLAQTVTHPTPGRWRLILVTEGLPENVSEKVSGAIGFGGLATATAAIPARLPAGKPAIVTLHITNTGPAPLQVGVDARARATATLPLTPLQAAGDGTLDPTPAMLTLPAARALTYLVPPGAAALTATSAATVPAQLLLSSPVNGVQAVGRGAETSTAYVRDEPIGPGRWSAVPTEVGPFPTGGATAGKATLDATVRGPGFDRTVTSSTGDPYLIGVDPAAPVPHPVTVAPGATTAITVTITPAGRPGDRVRGVLRVVTAPVAGSNETTLFGGILATSGDTLATVAYDYAVS